MCVLPTGCTGAIPSRGGSRISPGGRQLPGGRQHIILPNFPKNCIKSKEFGCRGGGGAPRPPLNSPLPRVCLSCWNCVARQKIERVGATEQKRKVWIRNFNVKAWKTTPQNMARSVELCKIRKTSTFQHRLEINNLSLQCESSVSETVLRNPISVIFVFTGRNKLMCMRRIRITLNESQNQNKPIICATKREVLIGNSNVKEEKLCKKIQENEHIRTTLPYDSRITGISLLTGYFVRCGLCAFAWSVSSARHPLMRLTAPREWSLA